MYQGFRHFYNQVYESVNLYYTNSIQKEHPPSRPLRVSRDNSVMT